MSRSALHLAAASVAAMLLAGCSERPAEPEVKPWAKAFGDATDQSMVTIAADANGNLALTGSYSGTIDFGGGALGNDVYMDSNVFVASLGADGSHRWSGATSDDGLQAGMGAAFLPEGDTVFAGVFEGQIDFGTGPIEALEQDTYVVRFDDAGKLAWLKHFSADDGGPAGAGVSDPTAGVAVGGDGNIAMAGFFTGTVGFGGPPLDASPGGQSAFVAKLDPRGGHLFSRAFTGAGHTPAGIAADADGAVVIVGITSGAIGLGDAMFDAPAAGSRGFIAKVDPAGAPAWLAELGGAGVSSVRAVTMDAAGEVLVGGCFSGSLALGGLTAQATFSQDGFVAKLSASGAPLWLAPLHSACVGAVAVDAAGHVHAGGQYSGAPDLGSGPLPYNGISAAFVVELDERGQPVKALGLGTAGHVSAVSSLASVPGGLVAAGTFDGQLALSPTPLTSHGGEDLFLARLP